MTVGFAQWYLVECVAVCFAYSCSIRLCKTDGEWQNTHNVGSVAQFGYGSNANRRAWDHSARVRATVCTHPAGVFA